MFKTILFADALAVSTIASAALLEKEVETSNGMKKICVYSDGSSITVSSVAMCPLSK